MRFAKRETAQALLPILEISPLVHNRSTEILLMGRYADQRAQAMDAPFGLAGRYAKAFAICCSGSLIGRCCGQTFSHLPHSMQSGMRIHGRAQIRDADALGTFAPVGFRPFSVF
ncbi:MAG: hypothetical protein II629_10110, partial [Ruminococcus sp.]|nr:hypothetical protein [Ruminococcus sp.]